MTHIYRFAEQNVGIRALFPDVYGFCRDYRIEYIPDFVVTTTPSDIDFEREKI